MDSTARPDGEVSLEQFSQHMSITNMFSATHQFSDLARIRRAVRQQMSQITSHPAVTFATGVARKVTGSKSAQQTTTQTLTTSPA